MVRIAFVLVALVAAACGDEPSSSLPRCEDICPMGSHDSWVCTRNPNDGIERCACPANNNTPEPCEGDL